MDENEHIETKEELLLRSARRMVSELTPDGFVSEARERTLALYSPNKEMKLEILLQVPRQRFKTTLKIFPVVQLCSKSLKKWWRKENLPEPSDVFFNARLDAISPRTPPFKWLISGEDHDRTVTEIIYHIRNYAVPLFRVTLDPSTAIPLMTERIWAISRGVTPFIYTPPIDYVLHYGSLDQAHQLFEECIGQNSQWAQRIALRYKELLRRPDLSNEQIFATGERWVNLAYMCGFRPEWLVGE